LTTTDNHDNGSPAADDTGACDMSDNDSEIKPESMNRGGHFPRATGEEDVEGHGASPEAGPESMNRGGHFPRAAGEEDETTPGPEGHK